MSSNISKASESICSKSEMTRDGDVVEEGEALAVLEHAKDAEKVGGTVDVVGDVVEDRDLTVATITVGAERWCDRPHWWDTK